MTLISAITGKTLLSILFAFIALMIMVTIHEAGHYTVGKLFKFGINEFAIGFGKPIFKKKLKSGEDFSIRMLPLGGFCAFEGEDEENESPNAFNNKPCYQRILVLMAGVTFNFLFAMTILGIYFCAYGYNQPIIVAFYPPAAVETPQVFEEDDILLKVNDKYIYTCSIASNLSKLISESDENVFTVYRDGEIVEVTAVKSTYVYDAEDGTTYEAKGYGISISYDFYRFGFFQSMWRGIYFCFQMIGVTLQAIGGLFTGALAIKGNVGGPITTISIMTQSFSEYGVRAFISMLGVMSASIAFMNILPLPALDGSRIVFTIIEWIRGKPVKREVEGTIHFVGLILLLGLTLLLDVVNLF